MNQYGSKQREPWPSMCKDNRYGEGVLEDEMWEVWFLWNPRTATGSFEDEVEFLDY